MCFFDKVSSFFVVVESDNTTLFVLGWNSIFLSYVYNLGKFRYKIIIQDSREKLRQQKYIFHYMISIQ